MLWNCATACGNGSYLQGLMLLAYGITCHILPQPQQPFHVCRQNPEKRKSLLQTTPHPKRWSHLFSMSSDYMATPTGGRGTVWGHPQEPSSPLAWLLHCPFSNFGGGGMEALCAYVVLPPGTMVQATGPAGTLRCCESSPGSVPIPPHPPPAAPLHREPWRTYQRSSPL